MKKGIAAGSPMGWTGADPAFRRSIDCRVRAAYFRSPQQGVG